MQLPPFLSDAPMQGDPPCAWSDFISPRLRRFPLADNKIQIQDLLGHGIEGCVAKVTFDDSPDKRSSRVVPYPANPATPRFFSSVPGERGWWPLERESRSVAVLEKVQTGLRQSSPKPISVPAKRTTRLDCLRCLYAFSENGRLSRPFDNLPAGEKVAISDSFTRIRKCFGWIRVRGTDFVAMNKIIKIDHRAAERGEGSASYIRRDQEYFAIVYEYIPSAKLEWGAVQRQLEFFHHIGFEPCQGEEERNWQGPGILLDFGDYTSPADRWFDASDAWFPCLTAKDFFEPARCRAEAQRKWDRIHKFGMTEEDKREKARKAALQDTTMYVERAYKGLFPSYFDLSAEERQKLKLKEDPLEHIRIHEIESETVCKAWRGYHRQKKEYLSKVKPAEDSPGKE